MSTSIRERFSRVWDALVRPSKDVHAPSDQRRARLLAALLVVLIPIFIIPTYLRSIGNDQPPYFVVTSIALVVAYILSRTRYHRSGAVLMLAGLMLLPFVSILSQPRGDPENLLASLIWVLPPLVLASLLYPVQQVVVWLLLALGGIASLHWLLGIAFAALLLPMGFVVTTTVLLLIAAAIRQRDWSNLQTGLIAQKRAEQEATKRLREQTTLRQVLEIVSSSLELSEVLNHLAEQMAQIVDATSAYIVRWDANAVTATVIAECIRPQANPAEQLSDLGESFPESRDFIEKMQTGESIVEHVDDPDLSESDRSYMQKYAVKSILYIPLLVRGELLGYVEVWESRARREFSADEIAICQQIARSGAIAIQNARLFERAQQELAARKQAEARAQKQHQFLQTAIDALSNPFYVINVDDYSIVLANKAARSLGITAAQTCYALTHHRDTPCEGLEHPCPLVRVQSTREAFTVEHIHYKPDGTPYYAEVHGHPIFNEAGEVVQMVEYSIDITARKAAERELRKLHRAAEYSANGIVITNAEGDIEYVNPAFTHITGYTLEEAIGQNLRILKSGKHPPEFFKNLWDTIQRGEVWQNELLNRKKNGELYWEFQTISPVKDPNGRITHFVAVKSDITERKQMEAELLEARNRAQESSRLKTQLLANVSHDMRTPLGGILGYTEMLQAGLYGDLTEEQLNITRKITESVHQVLEFTDNLLNQAEIESGKIVFNLKSFKPQDLLMRISTQQHIAQTKGIQFSTHIAPDFPPKLKGDLYWLGQILINLVNNAIKFTPHGSIKVSLFCPDKTQWAMQVTDTGIGIPPEKQEHIFEPFRKVDKPAARKLHTGVGLGLSIVKQLVTLMGGHIQLDSQPEAGSTFTVYLPLSPVEESIA